MVWFVLCCQGRQVLFVWSYSHILNILFGNQLKMKDAPSNTFYAQSQSSFAGRAGYLTVSAVITELQIIQYNADGRQRWFTSHGKQWTVCVQIQIMAQTKKNI